MFLKRSALRLFTLLYQFRFTITFFLFSKTVFSQTSVNAILVDGNSTYAATNYGVYVDKSNQFDWKRYNAGMPDGAKITILHRYGNRIYGAAHDDGLFSIADGDTLWTKINSLPENFNKINSLRSNDTALFVIGLNAGIAYTTDYSKTWKFLDLSEQLNKNKKESIDTDKKKDKRKKREEEKIVKLNEHKNKVTDLVLFENEMIASVSLLTPASGLLKSQDKGKTWLEASFDLVRVNINKIYGNNKNLFVVSSGLNSQIFHSSDEGKHWKALTKPPVRWITLFQATDKIIYAGNHQNGICVSYDNGKQWYKIDCLKLESDQIINEIYAVTNGVYVGTSDGIYFIEEKNGVWKLRKEGLKTKKEDSFFYASLGTKNGVTLYASKFADKIIFKIENTTSKEIHVDIKLLFECNYKGADGDVSLPKQKIDWRINVEPNSTNSYDTNPGSCSVSSCKDKTNYWEISDWKIN